MILIIIIILSLEAGHSTTPIPDSLRQNGNHNPATNVTPENPEDNLVRVKTTPPEAPANKPSAVPDNVVSLIPSLAAILAAVITAFVALYALRVNTRTTLRNQLDTQFYEVLKRFGDKDSPAVRAGASATLGLLGREHRRKWQRLKGQWLPRWRKQYLYFPTAIDQLTAGLRLEDNAVALDSIAEAAKKIAGVNTTLSLVKLYECNLQLRDSVIQALADFFALRGARKLDPDVLINNELKAHAKSLSKFGYFTLDALITFDEGRFQQLLDSASKLFATITDNGRKEERIIAADRALEIAAARLRSNVDVCAYLLRTDRSAGMSFTEEKLFLAGARLSNSQFRALWDNVIITEANIRNVEFEESQLRNSDLRGSDLSGADLWEADMSGAQLVSSRLWHAKVGLETNITKTEWWLADYFDTNSTGEVDEGLLKYLFDHDPEQVARFRKMQYLEDEVHPSVKVYLDKVKVTSGSATKASSK